ncbi:MAG: PolC-type DNA polymerase III, partial [Agathobacter sp.]|nr:PolC-type DNA polymerase III [Agathobacter sp.]
MSKTFLEVFPTLKVEQGLISLLEKAEVTKVSANHDKSHVRIYLHAERLIEKKQIWYLEDQIEKQLFPTKDVTIKIIESFQLSGQYNAQTLMQVYKESIMEELNAYSVLEYNLLRTATMDFETPSKMNLTLDDTIIAKTRGQEIIEFLEKVVCERCGMDLAIHVEYRTPQESKYRKNAEEQIRQEVQAIVARTSIGKRGDEQEAQEDGLLLAEKTVGGSSEDKAVAKEKQLKSAAKTAEPAKPKQNTFEKKGEFRKKYEPGSKKSDNPDVLYGRDF